MLMRTVRRELEKMVAGARWREIVYKHTRTHNPSVSAHLPYSTHPFAQSKPAQSAMFWRENEKIGLFILNPL